MADVFSKTRRWGIFFMLVTGLALSACTKREERILFNGVYYPTKGKAVSKEDRKEFIVTVRRANRGEAGARAAGGHGGRTYCLKNYGTSEIEWIVGPDAPAGTFDMTKSSIAMRGKCILW